MRRRQLKWLWARLKQLSMMALSREELLMKLAVGENIEFAIARQELDPDPRPGLLPGLREEVLLQSGQAALGRADEVLDRGIGPPHLGQHHLGRDAAVHQPDAPRLAVLPLDPRQEVAQGGVV